MPPNYLFPPATHQQASSDDLTQLDILLAGPSHTPFSAGVWKLHLTIPGEYPAQPPSASFRTPIFHPNVDPQTGSVCVETLKRDWDRSLTLRDVLITISCLLIQPNPDSALNAEAGGLIQEDYEAFARRARLMTSINAVVPKTLLAAAEEAQNRGQETTADARQDAENAAEIDTETGSSSPAKRPRPIARVRGKMVTRETDGSPSASGAQNRPFVFQAGNDDVFGSSTLSAENLEVESAKSTYQDDSITDTDQENDQSRSPTKPDFLKPTLTPRRRQGAAPTPLGELILEEADSSISTDADMEPEYPPSPRKSSPSKSPMKPAIFTAASARPESSRDAASRAPNITPPNLTEAPLALDSPFAATIENTPSPRKTRKGLFTKKTSPTSSYAGITKNQSPSSSEKRKKRVAFGAKLWELCGRDIKRWNRGDFDGEPLTKKAGRW